MVEWYDVVCDEHKEFAGLIACTNYHTTFLYHEKNSLLLCSFFNKHYGCKLRLIHLDTDLDFLYENGYKRIDDKLDLDFQKLYIAENNTMLTLEKIEELYEKRSSTA